MGFVWFLVRHYLFLTLWKFNEVLGQETNPGREALTYCWPIQTGKYSSSNGEDTKTEVTKVLLLPKTGRRHQLRVHLQAAGFPIVGDCTYGKDELVEPERMMLHSWRLQINLPGLN